FFESDQVFSLAIIEVGADPVVHFDRDFRDAFAVHRAEQQSHDFDRHAFGRLDQRRATAAGTIFVHRATQRWTDSLAGHFDQTERADSQDLRAGSIAANGV